MTFLTLACQSNCKKLKSFEGIILVYDEYSCPKCLNQALEYLNILKETNEFELFVLAPNSFSQKKLSILFREYKPLKILYGVEAELDCGMKKNTSLYIRNKDHIRILMDFY